MTNIYHKQVLNPQKGVSGTHSFKLIHIYIAPMVNSWRSESSNISRIFIFRLGSLTTVLNFGLGSPTTEFIFWLGSPTTVLNFGFGSRIKALNFWLGSRTTLLLGLVVRLQYSTLG